MSSEGEIEVMAYVIGALFLSSISGSTATNRVIYSKLTMLTLNRHVSRYIYLLVTRIVFSDNVRRD